MWAGEVRILLHDRDLFGKSLPRFRVARYGCVQLEALL
jgi:hypothetical protein